MKVYHGTSQKDLQINAHHKSRYGFTALFFATNIKLAELYAHHQAKEARLRSGGYIYECELPEPTTRINFGRKVSHCAEFRNLIHELYRSDVHAARIFDVFDYPSTKLIRPIQSDIIVVFDTDRIESIELKQENVKLSELPNILL